MKLTLIKITIATLCVLPLLSCQPASKIQIDLVDFLLVTNIVKRDSGKEVTKEFLKSCLSSENISRHTLICDDILNKYNIAIFKSKPDSLSIILVIIDGSSVENRMVFEARGNQYNNVKARVWPKITEKMVADLLKKKTGNTKYNEEYILSVAHSSYRVLNVKSGVLVVNSGIPDESWQTKIGEIIWNGNEFEFTPDGS